MVDEKVEDQVWVTVVATGYGDGRRRGAAARAATASRALRGAARRPTRGPMRTLAAHLAVARPRSMTSTCPEFVPRAERAARGLAPSHGRGCRR